MRRASAIGLSLAVTGLVLGPGTLEAQLRGPEVRSVQFVGNETFPRDSLIRAIATTQTECRSLLMAPFCALFGWGERRSELREGDIPLDVQRIERWYQLRGFREVSVDVETEIVPKNQGQDGERVRVRRTTASRPPVRERLPPTPEEPGDEIATVRFTIEEGRPILADSIGYVVPDAFAVGNLLADLPIEASDRWSTLALDATRDTLLRRLRNRGYPYADVLRQTVLPQGEPYHAHVTFEVEPGTSARYGDIRVEGIRSLDETTVLRTLPFRSGDPYRVDQLFDGQARLFGLEIVSNARVDWDTATAREQSVPDSIVPLFVQVTEGDPYRVRAGAGFNSEECVNTEARWTSRDFFGGGRVFQLRGRVANILTKRFGPCRRIAEGEFADLTWLTAVDFSQPWIFSTRNSFNASLYGERQSVPDIFIRRAFGLQMALVRAVGPRTPLTFSYRPELAQLEAAEVLLCTGFLICSREDIAILSSRNRIAPIGLNLTRDLANSLLNPTDGYRLIVDLEHAASWTGSEFRYDRAVVEGTWYSRLTDISVFASRLRAGWVGNGEFKGGQEVTSLVHPQKRFYAGGANSVRGFGQSRLGPLVLLVDDPTDLLSPDYAPEGDECLPDEIIGLTCDASGRVTGIFDPRPIGGTRVLEGNLEIRFALGREVEFVTFGDFGQVWGSGASVALRDLEFTPGLGVRYLSPVGPIRVDVGYNFRRSERLTVATQQIEEYTGDCMDPGADCLRVPSGGTEIVIPYVQTGDLAVLPPILFGDTESRFQLHLSIGQAF